MTYVVDLDAHELHLGDEKSSTSLLMKAKVLRYTYHRVPCYSKVYICILMLMTIYECKYFYVHILSFSFLSLKLYEYCLIL